MLIYPAAGKIAPVHPAVGWIVCNSLASPANNIYSHGSDKLTEVQLNMSPLCLPGSWVIRAFPDVEKPFLVSNLADKRIKKAFQRQRRLGLAAG